MSRVLLLSGIPASGKSSFGRWLAAKHGAVHLDIERGAIATHSLETLWERAYLHQETDPFIDALRGLGSLVVLDWGFPTLWLDTVAALTRSGAESWWFDGDRDAAREAFVRRGTVPLADYDHQMAAIRKAWPRINAFYGARMVESVSPGPTHASPETLLRKLLPELAILDM